MTEPSLKGIRVLIVEDNYVVADALRYLIDCYEGSVTAMVPSVERAFEALAGGAVDVAVLDINLHGTTVEPVAEHCRAHGIPFVFVTGYGNADMLPEHLRQHPLFDKPVEADRLVRALLALCGRSGS